jgi:hypothetical protein
VPELTDLRALEVDAVEDVVVDPIVMVAEDRDESTNANASAKLPETA